MPIRLRTILFFLVGVIILAGLDRFVADRIISGSFSLIFSRAQVFIAGPSIWLDDILGRLAHFPKLAEKNRSLEMQISELASQLAQLKAIESENNDLREALNLPPKLRQNLLEIGLYQSSFSPDGHSILANKGSKDGLEIGDVVITAQGVLIGIINQVHSNYSKVRLVTDNDFKATAQTLDRGTSGIVRGTLDQHLIFDFISQADSIKEGDIVSTDGKDQLPAGLIIGSVELIKKMDANIFKEIKVKPAFTRTQSARAFIVR